MTKCRELRLATPCPRRTGEGKESGELTEFLEKRGVGGRNYPEGRKSRAGEHWEIDPGKRLG